MEATIILTTNQNTKVTASEVVVADGFIKFKDASVDSSVVEEEMWMPVSMVKCVVWKDKPWTPAVVKKDPEDKK
jgi:hypothetical protein